MQGKTDSRGHPLDTGDVSAAEAFEKGMRSYVTWRTDAFDHLDAAIAADPDFAMAKLAKGWILQTARSAKFTPAIEGLVRTAPVDKGHARAGAYRDSLAAAVAGHGVEASTILEAYLAEQPTDLLAQRLVQFELFWNGRADWMREITERAAPHWSAEVPDYGCFLSCRAFSSEEAGDYERAEKCGREAVEIDAADCWGTHAVAHVLVMQGRIDDGAQWLDGLSGNWEEANQMRHHLWWHLCLFLLERGAHDRILNLFDTQIRNPESPLVRAVPDATIDLQNVASLLMRLELRGVDVGDRWASMADVCAERIHNHANAFSNAHDMMVLAGCGRFEKAEELLNSVRAFAASDETGSLATSYRAAGLAVCEAVLAHRRGEWDRVIDRMAPVRHDLPLIGGSHAQCDIFYQLLIDAAHRAGRAELVPLYFSDIRRIGFDLVDRRTLYRDAA